MRDETGAATVLAAGLVAALTMVAMTGTWVAAAVIARHRAQSVADLAALAAAARLPAGEAAACGQAVALAGLMDATVRQCLVTRLDVTVAVSITAAGPARRQAQARARAGPDR